MEQNALNIIIDLLISTGMTESQAIHLVSSLIEQEAPAFLQLLLEEDSDSRLLN